MDAKAVEGKRVAAEAAWKAYEKVKARPSAIAALVRTHEARAETAQKEYEQAEEEYQKGWV